VLADSLLIPIKEQFIANAMDSICTYFDNSAAYKKGAVMKGAIWPLGVAWGILTYVVHLVLKDDIRWIRPTLGDSTKVLGLSALGLSGAISAMRQDPSPKTSVMAAYPLVAFTALAIESGHQVVTAVRAEVQARLRAP
jgi:hypothetical protein